MFEVPYGQDPYSAIGRYIRENITVIEDIIAVIDIDGVETNELFMVDWEEDGFFVWKSDWYEGGKKIVLIDFFPVSEATNSSVQPNIPDTNVGDTISRQAALNTLCDNCDTVQAVCPHFPCKRYTSVEALPSADELTIVTEYCRKRNLVIITMESFRVLQAYYNRQNGMDGE